METLKQQITKMKNKLIKYTIVFIVFSFVATCISKNEIKKEWVYQKTVSIENVNPIGIAQRGNELWLSDADHNRLVQINNQGEILNTIEDLDRPMHIAANENELFIPQYGSDTIAVINEKRSVLAIDLKLDAPAGVAVYNNEKAIADFYNNCILYYNGNKWSAFGEVGNANGQFYYPTDVQITENEIWVADAYNHRVQVFDKQMNFLRVIGWDQGMNAATGIFISEDEVFVTDFENDRILIFDHEGILKQELKDFIYKPTDMHIKDGILYTLNYRQATINIYTQQTLPKN